MTPRYPDIYFFAVHAYLNSVSLGLMNFPVHRNIHVLQAQEVLTMAGVCLANFPIHASKFALVSD